MSASLVPPFALVRRPAASLAEGCVSFVERQPVDVARAHDQWLAYQSALHSSGWPTVEVAPDDALPDSVFIEDTVVMFGDLAVITNPGALSRQPETAAVAETVQRLGYAPARITAGSLDGGDVLKVGGMVYVGRGGRTSQAAIHELRELLASRGWDVIGVPLAKVLHLKSAVTALPDGTVIGFRPLLNDPSIFPRFLEVPEEGGAHVVVLDDETVLLSTHAPRTAQLLQDRGLQVVGVDISEFEKLEGCVTCLSVRIRTSSAGQAQPDKLTRTS